MPARRGGFEDGVALAGEVMIDDGADALVVVADEDGAFSAGGVGASSSTAASVERMVRGSMT